jgi:hypothetical protein
MNAIGAASVLASGVVARRVWAPRIDQALQSMVDDRRTDIALEQIERAADADGELGWGDSTAVRPTMRRPARAGAVASGR